MDLHSLFHLNRPCRYAFGIYAIESYVAILTIAFSLQLFE